MEIKKIRKKLEKELDGKRFEHTLGVAYTASALATSTRKRPCSQECCMTVPNV